MKGARGLRTFSNRELDASDRIERHIRRGGTAMLEGDWPRVLRLWDRLQGRCPDREALDRLLLKAEGDWVHAVDPPQYLPFLHQVASRQDGFIPLPVLLKGLSAMTVLHPVDAIGGSLVVHENVLVPRSQPLIHLLRRAMEAIRLDLPSAAAVLDMGCGSGVCSVLAAQVFSDAAITAADLLPEAVASTKINAERFGLSHRIRAAEPGDLFETLGDRRFDVIIFNAPWVVAPVRSRLETALNDRDQQTVRRFLREAGERLTAGGRIILGYADHSGPKAITRLESMVGESGLIVRQRVSDRIKTHRNNRPWQTIFAYDLARS